MGVSCRILVVEVCVFGCDGLIEIVRRFVGRTGRSRVVLTVAIAWVASAIGTCIAASVAWCLIDISDYSREGLQTTDLSAVVVLPPRSCTIVDCSRWMDALGCDLVRIVSIRFWPSAHILESLLIRIVLCRWKGIFVGIIGWELRHDGCSWLISRF